MPPGTTSLRFAWERLDDRGDRPLSTRHEEGHWFDAEFRVCRKMRSEAPKGVVEARFHRADGAIHDLGDLGEVESVHVMEDDDYPVLGPKRVDRREHDPPHLGLLGKDRRRALLALEGVVRRLLERAE